MAAVAPRGEGVEQEIADAVMITSGTLYGLAGLGPAIWGAVTWAASRRRAAGLERGPEARVRLAPTGVRGDF